MGTEQVHGVPGPFPSSCLHWSHGPSRAHLPLSWGFRQKLSFLITLTGAILPLPHPTQRAGEMGGCLFLFLGKLFLRSGRARSEMGMEMGCGVGWEVEGADMRLGWGGWKQDPGRVWCQDEEMGKERLGRVS